MFIKDTIDALFALKKSALVKKRSPPYIFHFFNVNGLHVSSRSGIKGPARLINALVHALNEEPLLPKYIIMVPDKDSMQYLIRKDCTSSLAIGTYMHQTIRKLDLYIERRKQDIMTKRPGSLHADDTLPQFIWIRMLRRPENINKKVFELRGKFNSILEERLFDGKENVHRIMSIEVDTGELTSIGKADFWREVNRGIEKFDKKEIMLKLRKVQPDPKNTARKRNHTEYSQPDNRAHLSEEPHSRRRHISNNRRSHYRDDSSHRSDQDTHNHRHYNRDSRNHRHSQSRHSDNKPKDRRHSDSHF